MKNTGTIALIICLAIMAYLIVDKTTKHEVNKTGVIQMEKLVYEFKGMKEASNKYSVKMKHWDNQTDSLQGLLGKLYEEVRQDSASGNIAKIQRDLERFDAQRQSLMEFVQRRQQMAQEDDKQMTLGVINQLNDYIKEFAKEEGYDLILCNNVNQPSIGYSVARIDITDQVLEFADKHYEGIK